MPTFEKSIRIAVSASEAFEWHKRSGAFERLQPPWTKIRVANRIGGIEDGIVVLSVGGVKWTLQHCEYQEGRQFKDIQLNGPFNKWEHLHLFQPISANECLLQDVIVFDMPLANQFVLKKLEDLFSYRHAITKADLEVHHKYKGAGKMRILIAGASGLIGSALVPFLKTGGHEVAILTRQGEGIHWDPEQEILPKEKIENFDVFINLSGENIAGAGWSEKKKQRIRNSRVQSTALLAKAITELQHPPKTFINASAIGYYGAHPKGTVTESSPNGGGFLAAVCEEWENAAWPVHQADVRTVFARFGVVLSPKGGALGTMLIPFKWGLGGKVGSGKQWVSWIAIDDVVHGLYHVIMNQDMSGPINFTAPHPVQNEDFTKSLAAVLHRPALFPLPAFIAHFFLGEMADETLLSSVKAEPSQLEKSQYTFQFPHLKGALTHLLKGKHE